MHVNRFTLMTMCCVVSSGCGVCLDLTRKAVEQVQYQETADELLVSARNHLLAKSAWNDYEKLSGEEGFTKHYANGFKQGFAEYLDGGSGEPPIIPPRTYWKVFYQTPEGHHDVEDWFAGYRMGVIAAEQSGRREWLTIPTSLPPEPLGESAAPVLVGTRRKPARHGVEQDREELLPQLPVDPDFAASLVATDASDIVATAYDEVQPKQEVRASGGPVPNRGGWQERGKAAAAPSSKRSGLLLLPTGQGPSEKESNQEPKPSSRAG